MKYWLQIEYIFKEENYSKQVWATELQILEEVLIYASNNY